MRKPTKPNNTILGVTFVIFLAEALIHYNIGKADKEIPSSKKISLPPAKSLLKIAVVVGVFSLVNQLVIKKIQQT
tara:strand:- start:310 stop:534 length:225 start_codon:yes stop_codon:yes gene_type:complete